MKMWFFPIFIASVLIPVFDLPTMTTAIVAVIASVIIRIVKGNN